MSYAQPVVYHYPTLPPDEITACLRELHIAVTADDLVRPTASKMQLIYSMFADIMMGVTSDFIYSCKTACEQCSDHPDLFADPAHLMIFYNYLRILMKEVGYHQFALQDLIKPEPKRVLQNLSAIINFAKFREERLGVYEQYTAKASELWEDHEQILADNKELIDSVEEVRANRVREEPHVAKAKQVNEGLTAELYDLKRVEGQTMAEYDRVKGEKAELTERLHQRQVLRQNAERDTAKVKLKIVHSPEQLKQGLLDMSASLKDERQRIEERGLHSRCIGAKADKLGLIERDLDTCIKLYEECVVELHRVEMARKKRSHVEETLDGKRLDVRDLSVRETQLHRQVAINEDKMARLTKWVDAKLEANRARMARNEEEHRELQDDRVQMDNEADKKHAIIEATQSKIDALREELNAEVDDVNMEFAKLSDHVSLYMGMIAQTMQQCAIVSE
ncbi:Nuf2 family-domain-containing protein [Protomyces lactucae-debilis]|uniref:Nuf2 family-domain-containing protein n=1 Tax=Protomyces lactucae-debilis TaxID=2754530 RepID=A0A1Y2F7K6_PROLT|nr:Nuf2 family-domain-containing protein [Protomyces lactucae-debilis]ORY79910.1 Nuf2 family-domain-containing protein [Protomyces lactucae-debilis]